MANRIGVLRQPVERKTTTAQVAGSLQFDWLMAGLSSVFLGGMYLDGWAHNNGQVDDSFFTPWHAAFYAGFFLVSALLIATFARNQARGYSGLNAVPSGYAPSLIGVGIFAAGGVGDMLWHWLFGIEKGVEALLSPTHLLLALGIFLIVSGPLRSIWQRTDDSWLAEIPGRLLLALSLLLTLSVLTFFTQFAHPLATVLAGTRYQPSSNTILLYNTAIGVAAILIQAALLMGILLFALRRQQFPLGICTLVISLNSALMITQDNRANLWFIPATLVAGLIADYLVMSLKPSPERRLPLRIFAFAVPVIFYSLYFAVALLTVGVWWTIHVWMGAIMLSGAVGVLLSYLVVPPDTTKAVPQ